MPRKEEIEDLLLKIAPLCHEVATEAQEAGEEFGNSDWARSYLHRTASVNQVGGTARWRYAGDRLVSRRDELPTDVEMSTTDYEQNQGRYVFRSRRLGIVLTIRRKPHPPDEQPPSLQLQIEEVAKLSPVRYGDGIVVYLSIPRRGREPTFEVTSHGKELFSRPLVDLLPDEVDERGPSVAPENFPGPRRGGAVVKSAIDADREEGDESEEAGPQLDC